MSGTAALLLAWPAGWAALDAGDTAWANGERAEARAHWQVAVEVEEPATQAAAAVRLLLVSGTAGLVRYGPRADAALRDCVDRDPWCQLAAADRELFPALIGVPGTSKLRAIRAAQAAAAALPGPATARLVWAGAAPLDALDHVDGGGMEQALRVGAGAWPQGPGTWAAGLSPQGARGQGLGLGLTMRHPDLGLRGGQLDAHGSVTARGAASFGMSWGSPRQHVLGTFAHAQLQRVVFDTYTQNRRTSTAEFWSGAVAAGPRATAGRATLWAGPSLRWDGGQPGHGATVGATAPLGGPWRAIALGEGGPAWTTATGAVLLGQLELRRDPGPVGLALRLVGGAAPLESTPLWRLPALGGGGVLRQGPVGRWRSEAFGALVLEQRVAVLPSLTLCPFAEGAWITPRDEAPGLHAGGGIGLRLSLPPRPTNSLRFDVAMGDGGLGISAGWGSAF